MKCSKGVFGAGQACQAMGNLYHDACFTCAACSKCGVCPGTRTGGWGDREDRAEHPFWRHLTQASHSTAERRVGALESPQRKAHQRKGPYQ